MSVEKRNKFFSDLFEDGEILNMRGFGAPTPQGNFSENVQFSSDTVEREAIAQRATASGANAGFGVAVRKELGGGGGAENLLKTRALWVDIDDPDVQIEDIARRCLAAKYPVPNYIVFTGGGAHCYWVLDEPAALDRTAHRRTFRKRLQLLTAALEGDTQCAEPARIMRVPGSPNMKPKYGNEGAECWIDSWPTLPEASALHKITNFPVDKPVVYGSGNRNNAVFQEAIRQREAGSTEEAAHTAAWTLNEVSCEPPLPEHEVRQTVRSAFSRGRRENTNADAAGRFPEAIEREIAIDFIRERGDSLKYEPGMGWMFFNGKYWERDESRALNMIGAYINMLRVQSDEANVERLSRLCARSLTYRKIKDMLSLAATVPDCWINADDFDKDGSKVNFENCTVSFTGDGSYSVGPHTREDYLTSALPCNFSNDSEAEPTLFLEFLQQIFEDDHEVINYLQKRLGSCLLGSVGDSKALIMYGDGANGKTVLSGILQECLGEYCFPVPASTLTGGEGGETKVASLQGKRLGLVHEFGSSTQLNDERFKMLTGGEALISGRHLYGRHFSFRPVTSFVIMSNYLPSVNDMTHGLWRRMALIHFPVVIPEHEQDRGLMRRIVDEERDEIIGWLVEGTSKYLQFGLEEPESCRLALQDYKEGEDALGTFLEEKYEPFTGGRIALNEVFLEFNKWLKAQGLHASYSKINFGRLCHGRMIGGGDKRNRIEKGKVGGTVYLNHLAIKEGDISWMR